MTRQKNHRPSLRDAAGLKLGAALTRFDERVAALASTGVDLDLIYSNSSLSGSDCSAYSGHNSQCDGLVTLKAARAFY